MSEMRRRAYLGALGIDVWKQRGAAAAAVGDVTAVDVAAVDVATKDATTVKPDWEQLRKKVAACTLCALHKSRTQTVFGVGSETARLMIIGEAPGAEEDRRGEPFVGRAGKLLDEMLRSIGLDRSEVYIANVLKCRPPDNRDPTAEEASHCRDHLDRQIELLDPRVILAVGRVAAHHLLNTDAPLGQLRGKMHSLKDGRLPLLVTYHPAYLLRSPSQKRKAWEDLCRVKALLSERSQ